MTNKQNSARQNAAAHFVHDFAGIDLPLSTVVEAIDLIMTPMLVHEFVTTAWSVEVEALECSLQQPRHHAHPRLDVAFGSQRTRSDALIFPVSWCSRSGPWIPPVDADIEVAAFGPDRTHVHLYGRSELPPGVASSSVTASLTQRLTVAIVRHVLTSMSQCIVDVASGRAVPPAVLRHSTGIGWG